MRPSKRLLPHIQRKSRRFISQEVCRQWDGGTFTLSLDYQQSKLTPHWGFSAQPSETYYLRKLSHNIFGIVDHTLAKNAVYVLDERAGGAKNADITISSIDHYIHQQIPSWARHLCLFMDNGATNKNHNNQDRTSQLSGLVSNVQEIHYAPLPPEVLKKAFLKLASQQI